ncbi:S-layer homology domain-containing protein [Indiicoccus explosivorum]|uniref:S-layer homology domain-containing protein n=1 Tax=Indiicoccus explosivorum TaxID=1917864 RepID=UPI000B43E90E|nr:S-layer homology domain-containing protein [Indiicoccus explosivorum]
MSKAANGMKRWMVAGTAAAVVVAAGAPAAMADFTDVSDRYNEAVTYLTGEGLANGLSETQFGVQAEIKRGDAAIILAEALGVLNSDVPRAGFADVPERGALAVSSLKYAGIVNGKSETSFGFNDPLTRGEMALMMADINAYQLNDNEEAVVFSDVGDRYEAAVAGLMAHGITSGKTEEQFGTNDNITRGEFAVFIHRAEISDTIDQTVAEVVSLDETGVLVELRPNVEPQAEFTFDVVNPDGQVLEMEPVPVAPDMTTAVLEFESPLSEVASGTWMVNGVAVEVDGQ